MTEYELMVRRALRNELWRERAIRDLWNRLVNIKFAKHPNNPIIPTGAAFGGSWLEGPSVVFHAGKWYMWYLGDGGIWYAESTDGYAWTNHQRVLTPAPWPSIEHPFVVWDDAVDKFRMWFRIDTAEKIGYGIGYAESPDGIAWTKKPEPIIVAPEDRRVQSPSAVEVTEDGVVPTVWRIYYWIDDYGVMYAETPDGYSDVEVKGRLPWLCPYWISHPRVYRLGGIHFGYEIFVMVGVLPEEHWKRAGGRHYIIMLLSVDGIHFSHAPMKLLSNSPRPADWDYLAIGLLCLVEDRHGNLIVYYDGNLDTATKQIGMAQGNVAPSMPIELWKGETIAAAAPERTRIFHTLNYTRKTLYLRSTQPGTLRVEIDQLGNGDWETLEEVDTEPVTHVDGTTVNRVRVMTEYGFAWARLYFAPTADAVVYAKAILERDLG